MKPIQPRDPRALRNHPTSATKAQQGPSKVTDKAAPTTPDTFVGAAGASSASPAQAAELTELLGKFGLEQEKKPVVEKRFAANVRAFVSKLADRTTKMVKHSVSVLKAFGLAVRDCTSLHDIRQLQDFAKLAIKNGQPTQVFAILRDVAGFLLKYPDEARRVMSFVKTQEQDTWAQKSVWMRAPLVDVNKVSKAPPQKADVVVIGGGISAAYMARHFAKAQKGGEATDKTMLVLEKDTKEQREHMASLRNAGIVCTALDYIFDIDEVIGDKAIERIQDALKCDRPQAQGVYARLMKIMHDATGTIRDFLREKNVDVELREGGGLDVAHTADDVEAFRKAAALAREYGLDWEAIDAQTLKGKYGIDTPEIAGALQWNDSAQLHPGKLVNALFQYAAETSKNVQTSYDTEFLSARANDKGDGWILKTRRGDEVVEVHAKEVIDAREAYAPYHFREARFSQIHIIDTTQDDRPMHLDDTQLCHGFTYMRKVGDNKFLVGSGDFPLRDPEDTPPLMASVALYAFANFMKVFPDAKFDLKSAWGGVFGLNHDEIPCVGELLEGWQVVGGSGGSGMNLTPALGEQAVANALGRPHTGPMALEGFSPRHYSLLDIRQDLTEALKQFDAFKDVGIEDVVLELGTRTSTVLARRGERVVFTIDEQTLDAASILAAPIFGDQAPAELAARTAAKSTFVDAMMAVAKRGLAVQLPSATTTERRAPLLGAPEAEAS